MNINQMKRLQTAVMDMGCAADGPDYVAMTRRRKGITFLANGAARAAFLSDGKVYKFQRTEFTYQSEDERINYSRIVAEMKATPERFEGWGVPEMEFITVNGHIVVIAEYIPNDLGICAWENPFDCPDAHEYNVFLYNGIRYFVDLG